jgi:Leu/Phe-tRNA-protein transferase
MNDIIPYINPEHLSPPVLETAIYPNLEIDLYYSDCWTREFYRDLARAGFIPIAHSWGKDQYVLLPEMQKSYAVLDWVDLHFSRHVQKSIRQGRLVDDEVYLIVERDAEAVIKGIVETYGARCWLIQPYQELMKEVQGYSGIDFSLSSVQLWSGRQNRMSGGELGYTVGGTYTSLSGFLDRKNPACNHMGTVQLLALARLLRNNGYAFWNLGQPYMEYKIRIGAKITPRPEFLKRWKSARLESPTVPLIECAGTRFSCQMLLQDIMEGCRL